LKSDNFDIGENRKGKKEVVIVKVKDKAEGKLLV
jgi:hypothetical protein